MTEDAVTLVRRVYELYAERRELPLELVAEDFEFDVTDVLPDAVGKQGLEAAQPIFRSYAELFEDFEITLEEIVATTDSTVVTAVRDGGRLRGSEAEIQNRFFHVWTVRGGKVVGWSSHSERQRALDAAAGEPGGGGR